MSICEQNIEIAQVALWFWAAMAAGVIWVFLLIALWNYAKDTVDRWHK